MLARGMRASGGTTITGFATLRIKSSATWPAGILCAGRPRAPIAIARTSESAGRVTDCGHRIAGAYLEFHSRGVGCGLRGLAVSVLGYVQRTTWRSSRAANHCATATTGLVAAELSMAAGSWGISVSPFRRGVPRGSRSIEWDAQP